MLARLGDRIERESLTGKGLNRPLVDGDAGEHFLVPNATPGIGVGDSMSSPMVDTPSPTTWAGTRSATATTRLSTTRMR